jgi:acetyl esterase
VSKRPRMRPPTDRPIEERLGYLDPELAAAVAGMPADATPGLGDITAMREFIAGALAFAPEPADSDRLERRDLVVPGTGSAPDVPVRVYRPRGPAPVASGFPALVWCHGGGFVFGDLAVADARCAELCERLDAVIVSVDYRLAPEHPFPAAVEDAYTVTQWVARGDGPDVDTTRVAVGGSSAGATLAAAVTLMARDRSGPGLTLQVLVQPATDDGCGSASSRRVVDPRLFHREVQLEMWDHYLGPAGTRGPVSHYAAPARASDLSGLPTAIVITAEHDPLSDEGREYAARLSDAGVATELIATRGTFHGFEELAPDAAVSRRMTDGLVEAVRRLL